MRFLKKLALPVIIILSFFFVFRFEYPFVLAQSPNDKLTKLEKEIQEYEAKLSTLKKQSLTLSNQIAQYNTQISLTQLKISETEEKIQLLGGRIDQLEVSLDALSNAFSGRVKETYKMSRLNQPLVFLLSADNLDVALARYHYLKKIQEADRVLLLRLQSAQTNYKDEKSDQENLQEQLEIQKKNLDAQKKAKANLLAVTKNDEKHYQSLLAQAIAQKNAFLRFISRQGGASILKNQTVCDDWGCYYNQRDSQWGNQSLGLSGLSVAQYGCLVSSVAMIASHQGINIKPSDIASDPGAFFGNTAYLLNEFTVNGINVKKIHVSLSLLDSELGAGRPVIAGLYGGPDHFIVILRKEGGQYIMHDPFLKDGANRPLSDKYSVSDITSLRLIKFY